MFMDRFLRITDDIDVNIIRKIGEFLDEIVKNCSYYILYELRVRVSVDDDLSLIGPFKKLVCG